MTTMVYVVLFLSVGVLVWYWSIRPSNARRWARNQVLLPKPRISDHEVYIENIRNFSYRTETDFSPAYYNKTFELDLLQRVYLVFTPFKRSRLAAHGLLVFEFTGTNSVAVSVEIRKKHNEKYSALKGLLKQYELMYVIADERDVIQLRTTCRHDDVYMHPLRLDARARRALFVDMMKRARQLVDKPEFYNTVRNACLINIARHINAVLPGRIPLDVRLILSGYADKYLHELGLFDTILPFSQAKETFFISQRARRCPSDQEFPAVIRQSLGSI